MEAIIRLGNGKYYKSKIFGIYRDNLQERYATDYYYIVFEQDNKQLIKKYEFNQDASPFLDLMVLITDTDNDDMVLDEKGIGQVDFLTKDDIEGLLEEKIKYKDKLEICKKYIIRDIIEYQEIEEQKDIDDFLQVTGWLHDAHIEETTTDDNEDLHVLFSGVWGCKIEIVFSGDISYNRGRLDGGDIWWYGCTLMIHENSIILVDEENFEINDDFCENSDWFTANKMKYKVIPN